MFIMRIWDLSFRQIIRVLMSSQVSVSGEVLREVEIFYCFWFLRVSGFEDMRQKNKKKYLFIYKYKN